MVNTLRIKRRSTGAAGPPDTLAASELAFNELNNTLYYGKGNSAGAATSIMAVAGPGAYLPLTGGTVSGGVSFGSAVAPGGVTDLSRHISLYGTTYGINLTGARMNYVVATGSAHVFVTAGIDRLTVNNAGVTVGTGMLTLSADPTGAMHAATRNYVDTTLGAYLPFIGGTMLGMLTLSGPPTTALHAVTKTYVDTLPVTATGSTTPRSMPDWHGDIDNAKAFGATGDGSGTGDVAAINAIMARQTANIGVGYLPPGRYGNFTGLAQPSRAMMWFLGSGVNFIGGTKPPGTAFPAAFLGSTSKPWFDGPVGFGLTVDSVAKAGTHAINIQRTSTYTGSGGALNAAFNITDTINPGVSSGEQAAMTIQISENGSNVQVAQAIQAVVWKTAVSPSAVQIRGWALTAKDDTGRMTSIAGPVITEEIHIFGSGPDDTGSRVMSDRIFNRVGTVSTDGPAGVARGMRMRGEGIFTGVSFEPVNVGAGISVETTQYAIGASGTQLRGFVIFDRAFQNDGANVAFESATATATGLTSGATASAATTLVIAAQSGAVGIGAATGWFQPGMVISGHASIPAGTTVVSSTVDATWNTTITMSAATTGTIPTNTTISFANVTGIGFHAAGRYSTATARLESQYGTEFNALNGINVGTGTAPGVGSLAVQNKLLFGTLPTNAANDTAAASAGVPLNGVYRNGSVLMVRAA